ncbi:MAG: class I SAM-dependent methyltransferase [Patescibacteria group bacterium]
MKVKLIIPPRKNLKSLNYEYIDSTIDQYYRPIQGYFMRKRLEIALGTMKQRKVERVLDVGYGGGTFIPTLSKLAKNVYGIDTFPKPKLVEEILGKQGIKAKLTRGSIFKTSYPQNFFDVVLCISVLEHFSKKELKMSIKEMHRVLKPGGYLIMGFPTKNLVTNFIIKNILGFAPDKIHPSGHKQIIEAIRNNVAINKIVHYPPFLPLDLSLYCVVRVVKMKSER